MNLFEKLCVKMRQDSVLRSQRWLWSTLRPIYNLAISCLGQKGLQRNINGMDLFLALPECRQIQEMYEPRVWRHCMANIKSGDCVVDVGAHVGLYTIALANRYRGSI